MNKNDSERIAAKLELKGYQSAPAIVGADLVIFNLCSVRQKAVDKMYQKIQQTRKQFPKKKIILTGCLLQEDKLKFSPIVDEIWPIINFCQPAKNAPGKSAFISIMTGCNNFCTYCVVPYTRGPEISRPAEDIIQEAKKLIQQEYQELILLGQNVNSYSSKNTNFSQLLKTLNQIPGNFKIRFLTNHPKDMNEELIETIAQCNKVEKYIHLPAQSGNNEILQKMNRGYTIEQYLQTVEKIRKLMPTVKISSDFIVGFPTETEEQFQYTVNLIKKVRYNQIFVAAYSPRPGTFAAKNFPDNIPLSEKKKRLNVLLNEWRKTRK